MTTLEERAKRPIRADEIREGERYELSGGEAIYCSPSSPRHAGRSLTTGALLDSDPAVTWGGVDAGFSPDETTLRAPDVAVGDVEEKSGWAPGVPPLAIEYCDTGQNEIQLQKKIAELLEAGTRYVWVVRLTEPQQVEIYEPDRERRIAELDDELEAPGILKNPVPVRALFDRDAAHEATFRNLLQRHGYSSLDEVRATTLGETLLALFEKRGFTLSDEERSRIVACRDPEQLRIWFDRALEVSTAAEALD